MLGGQNEFPNSNLLRVVGDAVLVVKVLEVGRDCQFDVPGFGPVVGILNPYALKGPVDDQVPGQVPDYGLFLGDLNEGQRDVKD